MSRLTTLTATDLGPLTCPYCGRHPDAELGWAEAATRCWGWCGFRVGVEEPEAVLLLQPDAAGQALLHSAWVRPDSVRLGHGRSLVQTAAAGLVTRGVRVLRSPGRRQAPTCSAPSRDFLRAVGFTRSLEDRRWHLDLDRTVVHRNDVAAVLARFVDSLRPVTPPNPAVRSPVP